MQRTVLKKLGIKSGFKIHLINSPENYRELLQEDLPTNVSIGSSDLNFIHFFTNSLTELEEKLPSLQNLIVPDGMIWVSWYKKSSKLPSEITEDMIRDTALALRLVDVKVCSVSKEWSALKLVIRKSLR